MSDKQKRPYKRRSIQARMKRVRNPDSASNPSSTTSIVFNQTSETRSSNDFPDLKISSAGDTSKKITDFSGRRFCNMLHFFNKIKEANNHEPFTCNLSYMDIMSEKRDGLRSVFVLKCSMCNIEKEIETESNENEDLHINTAAVLATVSTGGGFSQLTQQLAIINVPPLSRTKYEIHSEKVTTAVTESCWQVMEEAGVEEARLAREVDDDGIPLITVIADGAWSKRSYKTKYDASSGVACIVGARTGKLLFIGVRNKYCPICERALNKKVEPEDHFCSKNWKGPSTGMESNIILEGFKRSIDLHGLKYVRLVGDGDSSVYKKICVAKPYGNKILVQKVECTNHLLRNFCSKLRELATKRISSSKKIVSPKLRQELKKNILRLRTGIKKAVEYRRKQNSTISEQTSLMSKDILNCPRHVFGDHNSCDEYFCHGPKDNEENLVHLMEDCGLMDEIIVCCQRLVQNSYSLLLNMNNNAAETYNSVVSKFIGGKRINFAIKNLYQTRCYAASVAYNKKEEYYGILHKSITKKSPGKFTKNFIERLRKQRVYKQSKRKLINSTAKNTRKKIRSSSPDKDYGNIEEEEMIPLDLIEELKQQIVNRLSVTSIDVSNIERGTVGQSANASWKEARSMRLTASYFGEVCKQRKSTDPKTLASRITSDNFSGSAATRWGKDHEPVAKKEFEEKTKITVFECGFFICQQFPYLGASPDGIIDDDGIVEIKCPYKIGASRLDKSPEEAIEENLLPYIRKSGSEIAINKNHNYYYQIQGQLALSKRKYCYFIVWSNKGMMHLKIERDENFWIEKMLPKLKHFYLDNMLPLLAIKEK